MLLNRSHNIKYSNIIQINSELEHFSRRRKGKKGKKEKEAKGLLQTTKK